MIKIYKVESNKGMFRIYFEAGQRALEKYRVQFDTITQLENSLSAGNDDLLDKYNSQQEKNRQVRTQLYLLKKEIIKREVKDIKEEMVLSDKPIVRSYDLLSADDISAIAREISDDIPKILFLVQNRQQLFFCVPAPNQKLTAANW